MIEIKEINTNSNFMKKTSTKHIDKVSSINHVRTRIKSEVKKAGFTYETFAKLFGYTEGWFSNIVNEHRGISVEILLEIAKKLNIPASSLLPEEAQKNPESLDEYIDLRIDKKLEELKRFMEKLIENKLAKNK